MAIHDFYNGYQIDDSNINCGHIVMVDDCGSDYLHRYVSPCDLIEQCLLNYNYATIPDCIEVFLNDLDSYNVGDFVRISSSKCLEAVPLSIIDTDELVKVDATDSPGYLVTKVVGCGDVTVTPNGPAGARYLEICYSGPDTFTDLNDTPVSFAQCPGVTRSRDLYDQYVVVNQTGTGLAYKCERNWFGALYLSQDVTIDSSTPMTPPHGNFGPNKGDWFFTDRMSRFEGDSEMFFSTTLTGGKTTVEGSTTLYCLVIPEDGVYELSLKGNVITNSGINAFRCFIGSNETKYIGCVDCKFGADGDKWIGALGSPLVFPGSAVLSDLQNPNFESYFNMAGKTTLYCTKGTIFTFGIRVNSFAATGTTPRFVALSAGLAAGSYTANPGSDLGIRSGMSIQCKRVRKQPFTLNTID